MLKKAFVNGEEIPREAVQHEFERLARLYSENGMPPDELKRNVEKLLAQAQEQAIGAKLLLDRSRQLELPVSAKDVDAEVARVVAQIGGEENYRRALAAQGVSERQMRQVIIQIRRNQ